LNLISNIYQNNPNYIHIKIKQININKRYLIYFQTKSGEWVQKSWTLWISAKKRSLPQSKKVPISSIRVKLFHGLNFTHFFFQVFFKNVFYQQSLQSFILTYILVLFYYFSGMNEDLSLRVKKDIFFNE